MCQITPEGLIGVIALLILIMNMKKALDENPKKKDLKKIEWLFPKQYIHNEIFLNTLNEKYKNEIIKILEENLEIVATAKFGKTELFFPIRTFIIWKTS